MIQTVGVSMEPMLHNRKSTVVLAAKRGPVKEQDVVLYCRPTGDYVLHRVVKVLDGAYLIRGDNCIGSETVPEAWIIGVMTGYFVDEGEHYISCASKEYQEYLDNMLASAGFSDEDEFEQYTGMTLDEYSEAYMMDLDYLLTKELDTIYDRIVE